MGRTNFGCDAFRKRNGAAFRKRKSVGRVVRQMDRIHNTSLFCHTVFLNLLTHKDKCKKNVVNPSPIVVLSQNCTLYTLTIGTSIHPSVRRDYIKKKFGVKRTRREMQVGKGKYEVGTVGR